MALADWEPVDLVSAWSDSSGMRCLSEKEVRIYLCNYKRSIVRKISLCGIKTNGHVILHSVVNSLIMILWKESLLRAGIVLENNYMCVF